MYSNISSAARLRLSKVRACTHSALGYLGPEEFEARNRKGAAKAA